MEESDVIGGVKAQKLVARYVPGKTADESSVSQDTSRFRKNFRSLKTFLCFFSVPLALS